MAEKLPPAESRLEKVLAAMMVGVLIASVLSIFALVAFAATGQNQAIALFVMFPLIGLPTAAVLLLSLVLVRLSKARKR